MEVEFIHQVLIRCNIGVPSLRTSRLVMQDADKENMKEAIKKLYEMPTAGYLARNFDRPLAALNRTVIVSLGADAFANKVAAPLGHLHVLKHIENQVFKFKWWRNRASRAPAIAITFPSTRDCIAAVTIMQGWNGNMAWPQVDISTYDAARNTNTIWSVQLLRANEEDLQGLISAFLPSQSYRPSYQLEEYDVEVEGGAHVRVEGSRDWLASAIPQAMSGNEWRLTAMEEADCLPCLQAVARAPKVTAFYMLPLT